MAFCAICLIMTSLTVENAFAQANNPKPLYGMVLNSDSSVPAVADITFRAYVQTRTAEVLDQTSTGSMVVSNAGNTYIQFELATLDTQWLEGEIVVVEVNNTNGESLTQNVTIDSAGATVAQDMGTFNLVPTPCGAGSVVFTVTPATVTVNQYDTYGAAEDTGVSAEDCYGTALTVNASGLPVNTNGLGNQTVTYTATDGWSNTGTATRTVTVVAGPCPGTQPPTITLNGGPVTVWVGDTYGTAEDAGATAQDCHGADLTGSIVEGGLPVNTTAPGSATVTYDVTDSYSNPAAQVTRTVTVQADTEAPVITLIGAASVNVGVGSTYTDQGATATDNKDGDLSGSIATGGLPINTSAPATFTVTYDVDDAAGNSATQVVRTVTVVPDSTPPVITLVGASSVSVLVGSTYTDAGATATDDTDGNITGNIVTGGLPIDTSAAGTFTVTYDVDDAAGNSATRVVRTVGVISDNEAPAITMNPPNPMTLQVGDSFVDPGAWAIDNVDPSVAVFPSGTVQTSIAGTYTITYTATDVAGNTSTATRTVTVTDQAPDTTPPVVTLNGSSTMTLQVGDSFTDPGATAADDRDGALQPTSSGTVDTNTQGTYTITYSATDNAGNTGTATRTVNVGAVDTTPPVITLNGPNPATVSVGTVYSDQGATATDDADGNLTGSIVATGLPVDTSKAGTATVTYTVSDTAGNTATADRTVNVLDGCSDTTSPVVTLLGNSTVSLALNASYTDAGATARDDTDGTITPTMTSNVDTSTAGTYTVTWSATDSCGNTGTASRTVVVSEPDTDTPAAPVLTSPSETEPTQIQTQGYTHPEGTEHASTQYQISTSPDFSTIVMDVGSSDPEMMTSLSIPGLVLDNGTTYYVRTMFTDVEGGQSTWSDTVSYTTGEVFADGDEDGVPDSQEVPNPEAIFPNVDLAKALFVNSSKGDAVIGVECSTNAEGITMLEAVYPPEMTAQMTAEGVDIQLGLVGFKLKVVQGANVEVLVHFSTDVPSGSKWYVHDVVNGWYEAPASQYSFIDARTMSLSLTDGGFGDVDGVANGWIVDPSGYGYVAGAPPEDDGGSEDNCFIGTASKTGTPAMMALVSIVFGVLFYIRRSLRQS